MPFLKNKTITYLILAGLCFLVYANSLNNQFIFDDIANIVKSPTINNPAKFIFNLPMLVNSFNHVLFHENPLPYRLCNIIVHSLNTILLFIFLQLFFKSEASFLAAVLFAVHPIHTEPVVWITAGNYLYFALFVFIAYLLYEAACKPLERGERLKILPYTLSLAVFAYGLLWHFLTFYILMPFLLVLSDAVFKKVRARFRLWLPFFVILGLRLFVAWALVAEWIGQVAEETGATSQTPKIVDLVNSLFAHLGILLWPAKLTLYHEARTVPLLIQAGLLALVALVISLPYIYKKSKELVFAIGLFILFLLPTASSLATTALVAERYLYIPSIALSIFAAYFYQKYAQDNLLIRKKVLIASTAFFFILGFRAMVRNGDWESPSSMWKKTLQTSPGTPFSHNNMGYVYQQEGKLEEAIREYEIAIALKPNFFDAYNNLAIVYREIGKKEEAIGIYKRLIENNPQYAKAYNNIAGIYTELGRIQEAESYYKTAIDINPQYAYAIYNLGLLYEQTGRKEEARRLMDKAVQIYPRLKSEVSSMNIRQAQVAAVSAGEGEKALATQPAVSLELKEKAPSTAPLKPKAKAAAAVKAKAPAAAPKAKTVKPVPKAKAPTTQSIQQLALQDPAKRGETTSKTAPISPQQLPAQEKGLVSGGASAALSRNITQAQEYHNTAVKYSMAGRHLEAIEMYKKAIVLDSEFPDAYNNMGNSYNSKAIFHSFAASATLPKSINA